VSTSIFGGLCFLAGARQYLGSMVGLGLAADRNTAMAVRAAAGQGGWVVGASVGGAALAQAGYSGLGAALGCLFATSSLPYLGTLRSRLRAGATRPADRRLAAAPAPDC
jgi:hypothetical protein